MMYLKNYGVTQDEIQELKERFNDGIIDFLTNERIFITEKLEFLKQEGFEIYPILNKNIKVFLENTYVVKNKINKLKKAGFVKEKIQIILEIERLYNKV